MLIATAQARAEGAAWVQEALKSMEEAKLEISDQIRDGCLPRPNTAKNAAEVELRRLGFPLNSDSHSRIHLDFAGYALFNGAACVASYALELWTVTEVHETIKWAEKEPIINILVYSETGIFSSSKSEFQKKTEDLSARLARDFVLMWLRLRQDAQ